MKIHCVERRSNDGTRGITEWGSSLPSHISLLYPFLLSSSPFHGLGSISPHGPLVMVIHSLGFVAIPMSIHQEGTMIECC